MYKINDRGRRMSEDANLANGYPSRDLGAGQIRVKLIRKPYVFNRRYAER
jgi:hypothetical protein